MYVGIIVAIILILIVLLSIDNKLVQLVSIAGIAAGYLLYQNMYLKLGDPKSIEYSGGFLGISAPKMPDILKPPDFNEMIKNITLPKISDIPTPPSLPVNYMPQKISKEEIAKLVPINLLPGLPTSESVIKVLKRILMFMLDSDTIKQVFSVARGVSGTTVSVVAQVAGSGYLPFDTIADILSVCIEAGVLSATIASMIAKVLIFGADIRPYVERLLNIDDFTGGPAEVRYKAEVILRELGNNEFASYLLQSICKFMMSIFNDVAGVIGALISAFIPDDGGATQLAIRTAAQTALALGSFAAEAAQRQMYNMLTKFYGLAAGIKYYGLGDTFVKFMENDIYREDIIRSACMLVLEFLKHRGELPMSERLMEVLKQNALIAAGTGALGVGALVLVVIWPPLGILALPPIALLISAQFANVLLSMNFTVNQMIELIENGIIPNIKLISNTIRHANCLAVMASWVMSRCYYSTDELIELEKQIAKEPSQSEEKIQKSEDVVVVTPNE
jgi:hypothetical protein